MLNKMLGMPGMPGMFPSTPPTPKKWVTFGDHPELSSPWGLQRFPLLMLGMLEMRTVGILRSFFFRLSPHPNVTLGRFPWDARDATDAEHLEHHPHVSKRVVFLSIDQIDFLFSFLFFLNQ